MNLSDFGSFASIISLIIGLFMGFGVSKLSIKYNLQWNKLFSFINTGNISQRNTKKD
jgi:hypothetical protein